MVIHPKYIGLGAILFFFYLFAVWFDTLHRLCLVGGLINILVNFNYVNSSHKRRLILKSENDQYENVDNKEPEISVQFINLCKGFKYGFIGYLITLGIIPYNFYLMINPERNLESFKTEVFNLYNKFLDQNKT